jgi:hypothetical protein
VRRYDLDGYFVSPPIFSEHEIRQATEGTEEIYAGRRDADLWQDERRRYLDWRPGDRDDLRVNDFVVLQNSAIRRLLENPLVGAIAGRLARSASIRLFNSSLIRKAGGDKECRIGWHADKAYWPTCSSSNMLTAWIPLQDATEANGGLKVIRGSHRKPRSEVLDRLRSEKTFFCRDHDALQARLTQAALSTEEVQLNVPVRCASFHHCLTLHGSGPNRSEQPRLAVTVHLQDESNSYVEHRVDGVVTQYSHDFLCRREDSTPDYWNPDVCPILWADRPVK